MIMWEKVGKERKRERKEGRLRELNKGFRRENA